MAFQPTPEQKLAIYEDGQNILVSAGAGSGKTAVLSERTLRKVKEGVNIDEILILTFTKAAAYEMMVRIRKKIMDAGLMDQVNRIDKAYITTFDSFALSVVTKYHDRLNITKNVSIVDENVITSLKKKYLDEIINEYYENGDCRFKKLIADFCLKDDKDIRKYILNINNKLDLKYDKISYINNYLEEFYNSKKIDDRLKEYEEMLFDIISKTKGLLANLELMLDYDNYSKYLPILEPLFNSKTYEEIKHNLNTKLPNLPKNSSDSLKNTKEELKALLDKIEKLTIYDSKESMILDYLSTKDYVSVILEIILKLDKKIFAYKMEHNVFEFNDISKLAIDLVKNNYDIKEELKNSFNEIMIDEYQDTSDLQEEFIKEIANNNVYMVGDIKQSIYRFRNANPMIFKEKYDNYENNNGGLKIDLKENFRSRREVLENINDIFDLLMDDTFGGARYKQSHQMVFGNKSYDNEGLTKQNYNMELYKYHIEKDSNYEKYKKEEIEAFIIADDILNKVNNNYQIFDKDTKELRNVNYSDFVILMDRSKNFDLYKKIFEYKKIPLTILKNEDITSENEVYLLKNILILIDSFQNKTFDNRFNYAFTSVARSYLFRYLDEDLFNIIKKEKYLDTEIIKLVSEIVGELPNLDLYSLLELIIEKFDFHNKLINRGNVEKGITVLEYFLKLASNLQDLDYNYQDFITYLEDIIENESKIEVPISVMDENSTKIMTIHASKGLEYHICYYAFLYAGFNVSELKDKILYDNEYGIITPSYRDGYQDTFLKELMKKKYYLEEIGEKIRLFYVALTRCKEKMILVTDLDDSDSDLDDSEEVSSSQKEKYRSFLSFINSISDLMSSYTTLIDLDNIDLTDEYQIFKMKELVLNKTSNKVEVSEYNYDKQELETSHFSKTVNKLISKDTLNNMKFGTRIHEIFELIDFKNPNLDNLEITETEKKYITSFLNQSLLQDINETKVLKEYEFYMIDSNSEEKHGIIDLMLEYDDKIDIIDYKLKHIEDSEYLKQLSGYQKFIESKFNKKVNIYLYSIIDNQFKLLSSNL